MGTIAGMALGVGAAGGVALANAAIRRSCLDAYRSRYGSDDLLVRGRESIGLSETDLAAIRRSPAVAAATPLIEGRAIARGPKGRAEVVVTGKGNGEGVFASPRALAAIGVDTGDSMELTRGGVRRTLTIAGEFDLGLDDDLLVAAPLAVAQDFFGAHGGLSAIAVRPEQDEAACREAILDELGSVAWIRSAQEEWDDVARALSQVTQGRVLAAAGAALLGCRIASLSASFGEVGRRQGIAAATDFTLLALTGGGVAVLIAGRLVRETPVYARNVFNLAPRLSLGWRQTTTTISPLALLAELSLRGATAGDADIPGGRSAPFALGAGAMSLCTLLAVQPPRAFAATGVAGLWTSILAAELEGLGPPENRRSRSKTLAVAATAIATGIAARSLHDSTRQSLERFFRGFLAYDLLVSASEDHYGFVPIEQDVVDEIAKLPEVAQVYSNRYSFAPWAGEVTFFSGGDCDGFERFEFDFLPGSLDPVLGSRRLAISTQLARRLGVKAGDTVDMPTAVGQEHFTIGGVFADPTWPGGVAVMARGDFVELFRQSGVNQPFVKLRPGASAAAVSARIERMFSELEARPTGVMGAIVAESAAPSLVTLKTLATLALAAGVATLCESDADPPRWRDALVALVAGQLAAELLRRAGSNAVDAAAGLPVHWRIGLEARRDGAIAALAGASIGAAWARFST